MTAKKFTPKHREWLLISESELVVAKVILNTENIILSPVIFFTQQIAEKALKAYLCFQNQGLIKTHDLVLLLDHCVELDLDFKELYASATLLNPYISRSRYPDDGFEIPNAVTLRICIEHAEKILKFVKEKIETV